MSRVWPRGLVRRLAHPLGGVECRGMCTIPCFFALLAAGGSEAAMGFLVFL